MAAAQLADDLGCLPLGRIIYKEVVGMRRIYLWGTPEQYGNYRRAVEAAGGTVQFRGNPAECWALLLPGGGDLEPWRYGEENTQSGNLDPERDQMELFLLDWFLSRKKPVLGICRGIQVINVYFGGTLVQDVPDHAAIGRQDRIHGIRNIDSPLTEACGSPGMVNSAHHQALDRLGTGLRVVQWAVDGVPEGICHERFPVWGVQWHPERFRGEAGKRLIAAFLTDH